MAKKLKEWFDWELAKLLAEKIQDSSPRFDSNSFISEIKQKSRELELKDRVELIADTLNRYLSGSYSAKLKLLISILGPENPNETGMFTEWYWVMPIAKFVEKYGLEHPDESIDAIGEITKRNTGEYAIRPFLEMHQTKTLREMRKWSKSPNVHLRRLASEGIRIKLPWAKKLEMFAEDPAPIIKIIENLKDDDSKFVQKSVANSLNDILKVNRHCAEEIIEEWATNPTNSRKWIIKHALRNLRKKDDKWAAGIMGKIA
ncbi:MAG: 3-methyladenine DNA glycosylase [Pyrinomonadaceae bacterium]|nr:3-methyladenine DNA glycosylase [Pyrinomonadaceae bacterium]